MTELKVKKTFFSALTIALCTLLSRFTGLIRDIFFAKYLGSGVVAEAFYVAFRLPNTFRKIFAEGALSNVFIPFFSSKVKENKKVANHFSFKVIVLLFIVLITLTVIFEIFMPQVITLINPGFINNSEKFNLSVYLARITFPYIMLISIASFFGSILNSVGAFWQFSIISVLLNIILTTSLLFTKNYFNNVGECLSWFLIIGGVIQILFVFYFCIKKAISPFTKKDNISNEEKAQNKKDINSFLKKLFPAIFSSGIWQINIFVDGIFASFFNGANSYFYYTARIVFFPLSIIGYSLSTAILPALSVAFNEKKKQDIKDLQTRSINIAMFFSIPAVMFIFMCSYQIINLIYERGAFNQNDTLIVSMMLKYFILSVPFTVLMKIFYSCFYSQKNTQIPLYICIISLVFNIVSNAILMHFVGMNCIVISTTLSSVLSCVLSIILLKKQNNLFIQINELQITLKVLIISSISCIVMPILLFKIPFILMTFICIILHFIMCFYFKIFNKNFIKSIFKKKK